MAKPEKILIVGLGSIGRRYARLLPGMGDFEIYSLRSGNGKPCQGVKNLHSWGDVKQIAPKAAFITNPTFMHINTAAKYAALGMHLFIEKPLDMRLSGLAKLKKIVKARGLSSYVAYNLRFHPGIIAVKEIVRREGFCHASVRCSSWLPDWRPGTDHKNSYSANARMGGGAVLDLSHDVDYAGYIFGDVVSITGSARRSSDVTVNAEDVADMNLRLKKGGNVSVHVDFCSRFSERTVKFTTPAASYELDLIKGRLLINRNERITEKKYEVDRDFTYKAEMRYFFSRLGGKMMNDIEEASCLLEKLIKFKHMNCLA